MCPLLGFLSNTSSVAQNRPVIIIPSITQCFTTISKNKQRNRLFNLSRNYNTGECWRVDERMRHLKNDQTSINLSTLFCSSVLLFSYESDNLKTSKPLQPHLLITPICPLPLAWSLLLSLLLLFLFLFPFPDTVRSLTELRECKDCACAEHFDVERGEHTQALLY